MISNKQDITERTYNFAIRIVKMVNSMPRNISGMIIGKQVLRAGTSIGANIEEAQGAYSKDDFTHAINISRKEARETKFWLRLITDTGLLSKNKTKLLLQETEELICILTAIVKKSKLIHNS
ncbi:MAG: four helix bundle protein [Candidatus Gottesmanbacteria bacterium]